MNKKFSVKLEGKVFKSNESGFLDLNDIRKGLGLPDSKIPSKWDSAVSRCFYSNRNLVLNEIKHLGAGVSKAIYGDERATIGYAMWVSPEFYLIVLDAFIALRNGEVEKALSLASNTLSEVDANYLKRQSRIKGLTWDESCAQSGIKHSQKCREMLLAHPKFKLFDKCNNKYFVTDEGESSEYFYNRGNAFSKNTTLRVSIEGRKWLRENREWFNTATDNYMNSPL